MSRFARRVDGPHRAIRQAFEQCGCQVLDVSSVSGLGCDLVVWTPRGHAYAVEVKDGRKPPSARTLTGSEARLALMMPQHYRIVGSISEAVALATAKAPGVPQERRTAATRQSAITGTITAPTRGARGEP